MINNSALRNTMSVADLVPKAAPSKLPDARQGDNAFGEALAGAHSVRDRSESQASEGSRRDWAQSDRSEPKTRGRDRAAEVRSDRAADRGDSPRQDGIDVNADLAVDRPQSETDAAATTTDQTGAADDAPDTVGDDAVSLDAVDAPAADASTATGAAIAVAASPVVADLDAIVVPTTSTGSQLPSDAIDAAMRLALGTDVTAPVEEAAAPVALTPTAGGTAVETDAPIDPKLAATLVQGVEDAETGDVQAGPMRPSTSTPAPTSGPSPVQQVAAQLETEVSAPQVQQVGAASAAAASATPATTDDAAAQLVQATAVAATAGDGADPATDPAATIVLKGAKVEAATDSGVAVADVEIADADAPEFTQVARLIPQQAPTVAANAQYQAQVQAASSEAAAEEGSEATPAKVEALPVQSASLAAGVRADQVLAGARVQDGLQGTQMQQRIDHIAEQLATRLRLSQAAGGSQVQLSLKPRELGEVTVQMSFRDGAVAATILVDRVDTLRTLQTNIEDLKRSLESQGLQIQEFSVDVRGDQGAGGANARSAADLRSSATRTSTGSTSSIAGAAAVIPGLSGDREVDADAIHDGDVSVLA